MTERVRVAQYSNEKRAEWDAFVRHSKNGTFLFERGFMEYHADRFQDASLMLYNEKDVLVALFPANLRGRCLQSHAGLGLGGVLSDERMSIVTALSVFEAIVCYSQAMGAEVMEYKTIPHIYHRQPAEEDRYALFLLGAELYRRDMLAVVPTAHRPAFRKGRISDGNKARRLGLVVEPLAQLDEFWTMLTLHLRARHNAKPVHTVHEMSALRGAFPGVIQAFGVRVDGELAAGCLVYVTQQLAHVQYIASTEAGRAAGALDALFAFLILEHCAHLPWFDFGGCNLQDGRFLNRGLAEFKEGYGARAVAHDFYRLDLTQANPGHLR